MAVPNARIPAVRVPGCGANGIGDAVLPAIPAKPEPTPDVPPVGHPDG